MPHPRGTWGACQVMLADAKHIHAVVLDHLSDERPTLEVVPSRVVASSSYRAVAEEAVYEVFGDLPPEYFSLGVRQPLGLANPIPSVFAAWEALRGVTREERRWHRLPEAVRQTYQHAVGSRDGVTLELPSGPLTMPLRSTQIRLSFGHKAVESTWHHAGDARDFDWRVLDALPCLHHLAVRGDVDGLERWLATRPLFTHFDWEAFSAGTLDLRATHLIRCHLRPTRLEALSLPSELEDLTLSLEAGQPLEVRAADEGRSLALSAEVWAADDLGAIRGLSATTDLTVRGFSELDLARLGSFKRLRALRLEGAPGRLRSSDALAVLGELRRLWIVSCVDIDAAHMPALSAFPALSELRTWGMHQRDLAALTARWPKDRRVIMTSPIDDVTEFATADIPLRRWPHGPRKSVVCSGYAAAAKGIMTGELHQATALKALRAFVSGVQRVIKHSGPLTSAERVDVEASWTRLVARAQERAPDALLTAVKKVW